ncbi:hypothetical protein BJX70DRAFT_386838 [Aspergillus crustosus]
MHDPRELIGCGTLTVPMDYTDPHSNATIKLQLLKVPAVRTPKKGSILFNFGGSGLESRLSLAAFSTIYLAQGWLANIADPGDTAGVERLWAGSQVFANSCYNYPGFQEKGSMIGTAFSARDLMQIVDAVESDGLLRYWGISYGTILGATVAAMFPDRIERIVLDGVMNPYQFFHGYDTKVYADSDKVFHSFIQECLELPELCGFSHRNSTADNIEEDLFNLLEDLLREPIVHGSTIIDPTLVRTFIRYVLYSPSSYSDLSVALDSLLSPANTTLFTAIHDVYMASTKQTLEEMTAVFEGLNAESRFIGSSGIGLAAICANWRIQAKERYEGDFHTRTKHPMLVIGNTYDSATLLQLAQNATAAFEDSVLHGSTAHGSECTARVIRDYFTEGTLPGPDMFCEPSYKPFKNKTIDDVLEESGFIKDLDQ